MGVVKWALIRRHELDDLRHQVMQLQSGEIYDVGHDHGRRAAAMRLTDGRVTDEIQKTLREARLLVTDRDAAVAAGTLLAARDALEGK